MFDVFPELASVVGFPNVVTKAVKPSLEPKSSNTNGKSKGGGPLANPLVEHGENTHLNLKIPSLKL